MEKRWKEFWIKLEEIWTVILKLDERKLLEFKVLCIFLVFEGFFCFE